MTWQLLRRWGPSALRPYPFWACGALAEPCWGLQAIAPSGGGYIPPPEPILALVWPTAGFYLGLLAIVPWGGGIVPPPVPFLYLGLIRWPWISWMVPVTLPHQSNNQVHIRQENAGWMHQSSGCTAQVGCINSVGALHRLGASIQWVHCAGWVH